MRNNKSHARLTIDMHPNEHACLKIASTQLDVSMREFVLLAIFEKMKKVIEDEWLVKIINETIERLPTIDC